MGVAKSPTSRFVLADDTSGIGGGAVEAHDRTETTEREVNPHALQAQGTIGVGALVVADCHGVERSRAGFV
jgi:hypothetical protein